MQQIQLSDQIYQQAQQRAAEAGFQTVDEYVAEIVESDVLTAAADFDHLFTPEVVDQLDQLYTQVQNGAKTYSPQEVDDHFERKSQAWREAHGQ